MIHLVISTWLSPKKDVTYDGIRMKLYGDSHGHHKFSMINNNNNNNGENVNILATVKSRAKFVIVTEGCIKQCSGFNVNDFISNVSGSNDSYCNDSLHF